jgi:hypothetical protein
MRDGWLSRAVRLGVPPGCPSRLSIRVQKTRPVSRRRSKQGILPGGQAPAIVRSPAPWPGSSLIPRSAFATSLASARAHVEASGRRPQGRLRRPVRHRCRGRVRDEPRSRRPRGSTRGSTRGSPRWTPDPVRERVVALRTLAEPPAQLDAVRRIPRRAAAAPGMWPAAAPTPTSATSGGCAARRGNRRRCGRRKRLLRRSSAPSG